MKYDDTRIPENYDRARFHGAAFLQQWMRLVGTHAPVLKPRVVVDLGCGTGRFSGSLAETFDAAVVGIDPSEKMLHQTRKKGAAPCVWYARASGEALPLKSASAGLIFSSMAFHHFSDPVQVARECHRVLSPGGRVFLRTGSSDQIPRYPYVPFFPSAVSLMEERLPSIDAQRRAFERGGFVHVCTGVEVQEIAATYRAYGDKLAAGADSVLASLSEADFTAGLRAVYAAPDVGPVTEPIDFIVFTRP